MNQPTDTEIQFHDYQSNNLTIYDNAIILNTKRKTWKWNLYFVMKLYFQEFEICSAYNTNEQIQE